MAANATWGIESPAVNHNVRFEIEKAAPATIGPNNNELVGSGSPKMIGNSAGLQRVLHMVRVVAPTEATVLIQGETGTGKELIAEGIHNWSDRSGGPFVKVNLRRCSFGLAGK